MGVVDWCAILSFCEASENVPGVFFWCTHFLETGYDIRTIQELLGHKDVGTTMIYTQVLNKGGHGVRSPLDGLCPVLYRLHKTTI